MADCAAAMGMQAVILWDGDCGAAFDQASIDPYLNATPEIARLDRRVVATVELRGEADVYPDWRPAMPKACIDCSWRAA